MTKDIFSISPIDKGRAAFKRGEPRTNNPYLRGTPQFVAWLRGFNTEKANAQRNR